MAEPKDPTPEQIVAETLETLRQIRHRSTFKTFEEMINAKHAEAIAKKKAEREVLAKAGIPMKDIDAAWEDVAMENERERMIEEARRTADRLHGGPLDQSDSLYKTIGGKK